MTLQDAISGFLVEQQIRGNSERTVVFYRSCLSKAALFLGSDSSLADLSLPQLREYYLSLRQRGLSSVTLQSYIRALRAFLSWCYQEDYLPVNLSDKFRLPKAKRKEIDTLTDSEVRALLSCFNPRSLLQLRNLCICSLMLDSGLRRDEVVTLSLPLLHVREGYAIVNGKGNKQRTVPLGLHTRICFFVTSPAARAVPQLTEYSSRPTCSLFLVTRSARCSTVSRSGQKSPG